MKCSKCFNECRDDLFFCNICGAPLLNDSASQKSSYAGNAVNNSYYGRTTAPNPQRQGENIVIPPTAPTANNGAYTSPVINSSNGRMPNGAMPNGAMPNRRVPLGTMPNNSTPNTRVPNGRPAESQIPNNTAPKEEYPPMKREKPAGFKTAKNEEKINAFQETNKNGKASISRGQFVLMELLLYVPIVNIVLLFFLSFNRKTESTMRNYAIAKLICIPLLFVAFIIIAVILFVSGAFDSIIMSLENYLV